MKKITLIAIACLGISTMVAQTQRTILYEEFTGENCPPCASTNPPLTALMHSAGNYPNKIIMVRYQCNIPSAPGPGSLYQDNPGEVGTKQTYYSVPFAPYARFDGIQLPDLSGGGNNGHAALLTQKYITDSSIVNSPFSLGITYGFNATMDSMTVTAVITAAQAYNASSAGALKLQLALEESAIHFATAPGTNGEKDFYDVMRKMVPSPAGTALNSAWVNLATQTITQKIAIPAYIKNKNQLCFVGWIQDDGSKRVHQAAFGQLNLDAGTVSIGNVSAYTCNTSFAPTVTIKNYGTTTITSCTVNYSIDGGANQTTPYAGSLAPGATAVVSLPTQTFTAGNHTIAVSTSMPNGMMDMFAGNDANNTGFAVFTSPSGTAVSEGFVSASYPPVNWTLINKDGGTATWKRVTNAGGYGLSANASMYDFYNNAADGDRDHLFVPYEDLTGMTSPQLSFDYAYAFYSSVAGGVAYDSLAVMISTNCGTTWTNLWQDGGATLSTKPGSDSNTFVPTAAMWKTKTINLSAYGSSSAVLIKFTAINHYGNELYLDNVNLKSATGISTNNGVISKVNVYPNPASTQLNVSINLAVNEKVTVALFNVIGEQVLSQTSELNAGDNVMNFSTDKLANGIYSVLITSANGTYKTKIAVGN